MSTFPEEQLSLSALDGLGYFPAYPGLKVNGTRYEVIRKLGYGPRSSVWLVKDLIGNNGYLALKILTAHATTQTTHELEILQIIKNLPYADLSKLFDYFTETSHHGEHLCLGLNVVGPSVEDLRLSSPTKTLPVHVVQKTIASVVEQLSDLHSAHIIHGAVVGTNFLFFVGEAEQDVHEELAQLPPCTIEAKITVGDVEYPIVRSQPFTHGFEWNHAREDFANSGIDLVNYGHAQLEKSISIIGTFGIDITLRPPEVVLGNGYDTKADIWMLGCATYQLLTGHPLVPEAQTELDDGNLLRWLAAMSGDRSKLDTLKPNEDEEYLIVNENGTSDHTISTTLESRLSATGNIPVDDIPGIVRFIQTCLAMDPAERPTAHELMQNEWVKPGFACSCGYC